ncbi:4-hydroxybenzoate synthetase [Legionella adelaidensis]|uniref:4-hydroxybenzoate synthetase n=1 Tax=Legionella adelaidensis TaxID=45056 RepID=A0A0W0R5B1_9GAMM|nr:chorismate lyase [Legionella adelaidensis]KTC66218.1 4-hydroxybenzoate synthetase [Legionella adelaidensis]
MADTFQFIAQPPEELLPWLTYREMLSEKLEKETGDARLQVLFQQWSYPDWWDKYVLNISEPVLHREILMWSLSTPCWYARSIIPQDCYMATPGFFNRLENESLGDLIFNNPEIKRQYLMHYPVTEELIEYHWLQPSWHENIKELWARKSCFIYKKKFKFYLIEIFLPGLLRRLA